METSSAPAPAQAPVLDFQNVISKVASQTTVDAPAPVAETPAVRIVKTDPTLPLATPSSAEAPTAPAATETGEPVAEAPPATTEPVEELSLDDGAITLAAARNADGTFTHKIDPSAKHDFKVKDKATGEVKSYSKTIPELARMAADAIGMQQKVQEAQKLTPEVEYYRQNLPKWQDHERSLSQRLADMEALNVELLTADDEIVIQRREAYKAEMSPEKQLERMKAQETERLNRERMTKQQQIAKSFMDSRIAPAIASAVKAGVNEFTVRGIVSDVTDDLMVNGVIPPANWPEMERRINDPNGPLAKAVAEQTAKHAAGTASTSAAEQAALEAQKRAQLVVNDAGRQLTPIGRAVTDTSAPAQPKPKDMREAMNRLINRPLPETIQRAG